MIDLDSFNHLVLEHQDRIYAQAFWLVGDKETAVDLTQEAFLIAFQKLHTFRGGSLRCWLLRIVTNLCYDELRRRKRRPLVSLEPLDRDGEEVETPVWLADPGETPEDALEQAELSESIRECLLSLPPQYRAAVVLVDLQEMDYAGAAAALGISIGTVKSRLSRGRLKLRDQWLALNSPGIESLSAMGDSKVSPYTRFNPTVPPPISLDLPSISHRV